MSLKNTNLLPIILLAVSAIAIVGAVIMFAAFRSGSLGNNAPANVVIWGTIPQSIFDAVMNDLDIEDKGYRNIIYVQKNEASFENDLLKALAEGSGPDVALLNETQIISNQSRMQEIPFTSFPLRTYQDLYVDQAQTLIATNGILGFPFLIDPLVMYFNKDILNNNGFARPPETWTQMLAITPTITIKDSSFNISRSTIALGSSDNINNSKEIYWTLVMQAGNSVIQRFFDDQNQKDRYQITLNNDLNLSLNPAFAATNFYTQFSNPTKTIYSWNKSLPDSQTAFVSGDLAFYLGFASELPVIKKINPNLNFDVAMVPQSQSSSRKVTYGSLQIFTIPKTTQNTLGAIQAIAKLTSTEAQKAFAENLGIAAVRKDMLTTYDVTNSYEEVFNRSAIIAQGILEPDASQTSAIIKELIDTVVSGQYEITQALQRAQQKLTALIYE